MEGYWVLELIEHERKPVGDKIGELEDLCYVPASSLVSGNDILLTVGSKGLASWNPETVDLVGIGANIDENIGAMMEGIGPDKGRITAVAPAENNMLLFGVALNEGGSNTYMTRRGDFWGDTTNYKNHFITKIIPVNRDGYSAFLYRGKKDYAQLYANYLGGKWLHRADPSNPLCASSNVGSSLYFAEQKAQMRGQISVYKLQVSKGWLWDHRKKIELLTIPTPDSKLTSMAVSSGGEFLFFAFENGKIRYYQNVGSDNYVGLSNAYETWLNGNIKLAATPHDDKIELYATDNTHILRLGMQDNSPKG